MDIEIICSTIKRSRFQCVIPYKLHSGGQIERRLRGGGRIFIYSCSTLLISFEFILIKTDFEKKLVVENTNIQICIPTFNLKLNVFKFRLAIKYCNNLTALLRSNNSQKKTNTIEIILLLEFECLSIIC